MIPQLLKGKCSSFAKYQALLHLTHYLVNPLIIATVVLSFPLVHLQTRNLGPWTASAVFFLFALSTFGPSALYLTSQRVLYPDWRSKVRWIPLLTLVGSGIALSNSKAVLEGLFSSGGEFVRTPKFGFHKKLGGVGKPNPYRHKLGLLPFLELALGLYCLYTFGLTLNLGARSIWISPFLLIYACGFLYISTKGLWEWSRQGRAQCEHP